jgi:hypothetical protein
LLVFVFYVDDGFKVLCCWRFILSHKLERERDA